MECRSPRAWFAGALAVCGLATIGASPALAASGKQRVRGGIDAAAIPGAKVFGNTPSKTPETVSFIFKEQNASQLEAKVESGFSPYLSVSQFAATYGEPSSTIQSLESYLAGYGISTTAYADHIDVVANGTAGEFDKALSVSQKQYRTPPQHNRAGGPPIPSQTFHGTTDSPSLPASIASQLTAILGLTNYASQVSNIAHVNPQLVNAARSAATQPARQPASQPGQTISQSECTALSGFPEDCNLPQDFASDYGLNSVYADGADGQGQTLAILTFATVDTVPGSSEPSPSYFWNNFLGLHRTGTVKYENIDGGAGTPSFDAGSVETDVDTEQSGALAPGANIIVYQAPNDDSGFIDTFLTAASQNIAGSVSISWGDSETYLQALVAQGQETSGYFAAVDEALLELAAQGQSTFSSSGDSGAYDATGDLGTTNLSVDNPSSSPYVTSAGGTTIPWSVDLGPAADGSGDVTVTVPHQRMWGWDYLWKPFAALEGIDLLTSAETLLAGDGGGFSSVEATPAYQQGVSGTSSFTAVPWLTPTDFDTANDLLLPEEFTINPNPTDITGTGSGRALPDLATNADPNTGYAVYSPTTVGNDGITTPLFYGLGGTSFAAPQLNGSTAVIDSLLGHRVGFWNPSIYKFAQSADSPFTPLDTSGQTNDNLYYSGTAGAVFDPGAGLGIPNLGKLAVDFGSGS